MAEAGTVIAAGVFTLLGAGISTLTAFLLARQSDRRREAQELRRERQRVYAVFLHLVAEVETSARYLRSVLIREAGAEIDGAWSGASSARDNAHHVFWEIALIASDDVKEAARMIMTDVDRTFESAGERRDGPSLDEPRAALVGALQDELGINLQRDSGTAPQGHGT